jgi:hypothetical protein
VRAVGVKKIKTVKLSFILLLAFCFLTSLPSLKIEAASGEMSIELKPDRILFNTVKLAPGRSIEEVITIQNREKMGFTYESSVNFLEGSKSLFNELTIMIWDTEKLIFKGGLSEFKGYGERKLNSLHGEDLKIQVGMPSHLGNEFQGKRCEFEITFTIKEDILKPEPVPDQDETEPTPSPTPEQVVKPQRPISDSDLDSKPLKGQILPNTATNIYQLLTVGALLVLLGIATLLYRRLLIRSKD